MSDTANRTWDEWLALDFGEPDWLIPGLLERGGGGLIHGASRAYKSFFLLRLCLDLAAGKPVMDIWPLPKTYRTFLLQAEGSERSWQRRMIALREVYPAGIPFWSRHSLTVKLDTPEGQDMMAEALAVVRPDLVVVDPIANFFRGSENDSDNMQRWLDTVNMWRAVCGCAVILCHHDRQTQRHFGKGGSMVEVSAGMEEARGHTRLPAWADFVGGFRRKVDTTTLTIEKVRDAEDQQQFSFQLRDGKLVLTERSDALGLFIMQYVGEREVWLADIVTKCQEDVSVSEMTARRGIQMLVERNKLAQTQYGRRYKVRRTVEGES